MVLYMKNLIEIAQGKGANIVKENYLINVYVGEIVFDDEAQLQATFDTHCKQFEPVGFVMQPTCNTCKHYVIVPKKFLSPEEYGCKRVFREIDLITGEPIKLIKLISCFHERYGSGSVHQMASTG